MAKFKGKNSIKSVRQLAGARVSYNSQAFPGDPPQVVDFNFAEKTLYGRVDRTHAPVIPDQQFIVPVAVQNGEGPTILLMNFVADQYLDFEAHFANACKMGLLPQDDPVFGSLQAKRGYLDASTLYESYSDNLMGLYANQFLTNFAKDITGFEDYLRYFPQYMAQVSEIFPITFSGFQRSRQSTLFSSGLAIDIAGVSFSNDEQKQTMLFDSRSFEFYLGLAKQYGFSVNKRNPGVLISDLASPVTTEYREKYGLSSVNLVFSSQFTKTLYSDLPELTYMMIEGYNSFVNSNRIKTKFKVCNNKLQQRIIKRNYLDKINHIEYNNIINIYIITRNIEEGRPFSQIKIRDIINTASRMLKISENSMLDYVDAQFASKYNQKDGSLTYYKRKLQKIVDKE